MEEAQVHKDTFEYYYALGDKRSLQNLHQYCTKTAPGHTPSLRTLKNWSKWFNWQERIMLRDREISKKVEKRILKEEEDIRLNTYKKIKQLSNTLSGILGTAFYKDKEDNNKIKVRPELEITTARELKDVVIGALKCETEALHILAPEPPQEPSSVTITIKSAHELPEKN